MSLNLIVNGVQPDMHLSQWSSSIIQSSSTTSIDQTPSASISCNLSCTPLLPPGMPSMQLWDYCSHIVQSFRGRCCRVPIALCSPVSLKPSVLFRPRRLRLVFVIRLQHLLSRPGIQWEVLQAEVCTVL
jgi:hypothetical protein